MLLFSTVTKLLHGQGFVVFALIFSWNGSEMSIKFVSLLMKFY